MPVLYLVEQGATLRKQGELLVITKEGQTLQEVTAAKVEQVVVLGNVNPTTPVIHYFLQEGIDCVFCSSFGRYHGRLISIESRFGLLRQRQLQAVSDPVVRVTIARQVVRGKLLNQRTFLMRFQRERPSAELVKAIDAIQTYADRLDFVHDIGAIQGLEGQAAALYYGAFSGGVFLTPEGVKKFIHHFEERVQTRVLHTVDAIQVKYRRCFELQARHLARTILKQEPLYQPFLVK